MYTLTTFELDKEVQVYADLSRSELTDMIQDLTDLGIKFSFEKQP